MKLDEIRTLARSQRIKPGNLSKAELITTIQAQEGNFKCYGTAYNGKCDQTCGLWRDDCLDASIS